MEPIPAHGASHMVRRALANREVGVLFAFLALVVLMTLSSP